MSRTRRIGGCRKLSLALTVIMTMILLSLPVHAQGEESISNNDEGIIQIDSDELNHEEEELDVYVESQIATVREIEPLRTDETGVIPQSSDADKYPVEQNSLCVQSTPAKPGNETLQGQCQVNQIGPRTDNEDVVLTAQASRDTPHASYRTHIQTVGWQGWKRDGKVGGTSGRSLRLEAIQIKLSNKPLSGAIQYRTHVQTYGWQSWKKNGATSGTSGEAKRLEAIQIKLSGQMSTVYDVWYRVHAQSFGWMGWAKNGDSAGTSGYAYRLEAIQIKLLRKGELAPGSTKNAFKQKSNSNYIVKGNGWSFKIPSYWHDKVSVSASTSQYSNGKVWRITAKNVKLGGKRYEVLTILDKAHTNDYESNLIERVRIKSGQFVDMRGYSLTAFLRAKLKNGKDLELTTDVFGPDHAYDYYPHIDTAYLAGKADLQSFGAVKTYNDYMRRYRSQRLYEWLLAESCLRNVAKNLSIS